MKKIIIAGLISAFSLSAPVFAEDSANDPHKSAKNGSLYSNIGVADIKDIDDTAIIMTLGYERDISYVEGLSAGLDVTYTASEAEVNTSNDDSDTFNYLKFGVFTKYSYDLSPLISNLSANIKTGYSSIKTNSQFNDVKTDDRYGKVVYGAGLKYDLDEAVSLTSDYLKVGDIDQYTIGFILSL